MHAINFVLDEFFNNSPHWYVLVIAIPFLYSQIDRWWGDNKNTKRLSKLMLVVTGAVGWAAAGPVGFYAALGWLIYRSFGFHTKNGLDTNAPETPAERSATLWRHLVIMPLMAGAYLLTYFHIKLVSGPSSFTVATLSNLDWAINIGVLLIGMLMFFVYAKQASDLAYGYGDLAAKAYAGDAAAVELLSPTGGNYYGHVGRQRGLYYGFALGIWLIVICLAKILAA